MWKSVQKAHEICEYFGFNMRNKSLPFCGGFRKITKMAFVVSESNLWGNKIATSHWWKMRNRVFTTGVPEAKVASQQTHCGQFKKRVSLQISQTRAVSLGLKVSNEFRATFAEKRNGNQGNQKSTMHILERSRE